MNPLADYVQGRVKAGLSKPQIKDELLAVGWSEEEADGAYRDGLVALGIPLPSAEDRPTLARQSSTVDIVINFFSFILLGIVAIALGTLYFQVINHAFPDPLAAMHGQVDRFINQIIHHAIASLVIGFPLYVVSMRFWFRRFHADEGRVESRLTKWLTYILLLVASVTIVGDLITVLYKLLQGEISVRFLLKALTILTIAGLVFGFYFLERRKIQYRKGISRSVFQGFGWAVTGIVGLGIVLGFLTAGSPEQARKHAFDEERAGHLGELSRCIDRYARELGQLPPSLEELKKTSQFAYCGNSMQDPETKAQYEYRIVTASREQGPAKVGEFELCATFALPSVGGGREYFYSDRMNAIWQEHPAGRSCDTVTAQLVGRKATPLPSD
jgi:hypothetical protein